MYLLLSKTKIIFFLDVLQLLMFSGTLMYLKPKLFFSIFHNLYFLIIYYYMIAMSFDDE
jgi:hypothetical protein